jgi:hypothetical protein
MEAAQAIGKALSFEEVWAIVQENARGLKELREEIREAQRETARQMEETDRRMKENARGFNELREAQRETAKQMKETDGKISKLGGRFGEMIEYMVKPNLTAKFRELGFAFTKIYQDTNIKDEKNEIVAETDFTLENGDKVMIVEVKSKPSVEDVKHHVECMGIMRRHADLHGDARKYLGAVAGMVVGDNVRKFALKSGFYVIVPSGDTFDIIEPSGEYRPREW